MSDGGDDDSVSIARGGILTSFGSEGSSKSGNSQHSRGSFRVFGIKHRSLKMKVKHCGGMGVFSIAVPEVVVFYTLCFALRVSRDENGFP